MGLFHKLDIFVHKFLEQCSSLVLIHPTCLSTQKILQEHHNFLGVLVDKIQFLVQGESKKFILFFHFSLDSPFCFKIKTTLTTKIQCLESLN